MQTDKPQYQDLLKKPITELAEMAKTHVKDESALEKKASAFKKSHALIGKVIAAFKVTYVAHTDGDKTPKLPKGTPFKDYHKQVTGDYPNNHAEACANTFNGYVLTGLIKEQDYDLCALDWLETASAILNHCKNDVSASAVLDAAEILKLRPETGAKDLRELKKSVAPAKAPKDGESTVAETDKNGDVKIMTDLTPAITSEILRNAFDRGFHGFIIAELIAEIQHMKCRKESLQKDTFQAMPELTDAWENSGIEESKLNAWMEEIDKSRVPSKPAVLPAPAVKPVPALVAA